MVIKSESGVYTLLETMLQKTTEPLTCRDLWEAEPKLHKYAEDPNRISDYLGHMWRRGLLQRWYAPKDSKSLARYAYTWKDQGDQETRPVNDPPKISSMKTKTIRPNVTITEEDDCVVLDFEQFTITVRRKA